MIEAKIAFFIMCFVYYIFISSMKYILKQNYFGVLTEIMHIISLFGVVWALIDFFVWLF